LYDSHKEVDYSGKESKVPTKVIVQNLDLCKTVAVTYSIAVNHYSMRLNWGVKFNLFTKKLYK